MTIGELRTTDTGREVIVVKGTRCEDCVLFKEIDECLRTPCGTTGGDEVIFKEAKE